MRLKDKMAIVTGGGIGLGRAYCKALAEEGAKVIVADIQQDAAQSVAKEVKGLAVRVDVTSDGGMLERTACSTPFSSSAIARTLRSRPRQKSSRTERASSARRLPSAGL